MHWSIRCINRYLLYTYTYSLQSSRMRCRPHACCMRDIGRAAERRKRQHMHAWTRGRAPISTVFYRPKTTIDPARIFFTRAARRGDIRSTDSAIAHAAI